MELFLIYSDYLLTEHALTSTHSPPFILSRIGQTFLYQFSPTLTQSIAIVRAKLCNRPRKALHPPTQSFASADANVCLKRRPFRNPFPMFSTEPYFHHKTCV